MIKSALVLVFSFFGITSFAQTTVPRVVTSEIATKINGKIETAAAEYRSQLNKKQLDKRIVEFSVDTFRVNHVMNERLAYDYSTAGMSESVYEAEKAYDRLLNTYYQKLLKLLKTEDKQTLVTAQKSWIAFRNAELKLNNSMAKEAYSGGGTIQSNVGAARRLALVKARVEQLFEYYSQKMEF